jgi:outer membrane immunogenic protein
MTKLGTAIAAIALAGTPAFAADMAVKAAPKAPIVASDPWSGFYIRRDGGVRLRKRNDRFDA